MKLKCHERTIAIRQGNSGRGINNNNEKGLRIIRTGHEYHFFFFFPLLPSLAGKQEQSWAALSQPGQGQESAEPHQGGSLMDRSEGQWQRACSPPYHPCPWKKHICGWRAGGRSLASLDIWWSDTVSTKDTWWLAAYLRASNTPFWGHPLFLSTFEGAQAPDLAIKLGQQ